MKTYKGETKTKLPGTDKSTTIASWEFTGPENAAEFATWSAANPSFVVTGVVTATGKALDPTTVENFPAWLYGASLKANTAGRDAADIAAEVKDHKLSFQGKTTDLDTLSNENLAKACNLFNDAIAMGVNIGTTNAAKLSDAITKAIAAATIHAGKDGRYVAGPAPKNGGAVKK
jgi:hypothetical protein